MSERSSRNSEPERAKSTVFKSAVYRIPALFYEKESKTLLAFAEQRRTEDDASTEALVMKTGKVNKDDLSDVKIKWSEFNLVEKAHLDGYRPMNPCPLYDSNSKTLFLFFVCVEGTVSERYQLNNYSNKVRLCYITSTDVGQTWSEVTDLTDELSEIGDWATFAIGPGHGLQTSSGRLIVPTYAYLIKNSLWRWLFKHGVKIGKYPSPYALSLYSDDGGKSWELGKMLQTPSIECEMAEIFDEGGQSVIYCNARSKGGYRVEALDKNDKAGFITLSSAKKLVETDDGCQGSVVSFPAGDVDSNQNSNHWLLFTHPSKESRSDLGVYLNQSPVNPETWSEPWIINKGPSGYSDLAYIGKGWFACLLECGKDKYTEQIACKVFNYREVLEGIKK